MSLNTQHLPEQDAGLAVQCLLVNDEFAAMGRVGVISSAAAFLAGYNLRLLTVVQAMSQLDAVYGEKDARTFATNHGLQILYAPREQRDADEYSAMLGQFTERATSRGHIATAHAAHQRPRCLCLVEGVEMYVARLAGSVDGYLVKRMPDTGCHHAPDCASYEPPAELSGLGQVLGSAITEDPATGETALKLGFAMSKIEGRSTMPAAGVASDSVSSDGTRLSLRGLLHYLWDQAELTHWQPGFAGKRSWGTVRRHLLTAAQNKIARSGALNARLYIPEVFSVEQREGINARRVAQWATALAAPGKPQHLMLLIAEVKEIVPARYGYKAVIKHVPDQAFLLDEQLYRRLGRCFERELSLWGASDQLHMVMIATFGMTGAGLPVVWEVCLMPVNGQWLPVEDSFEQQLLDKLVNEKRAFIKALRYNVPRDCPLCCAVLNDTGNSPATLWISTVESGAENDATEDVDFEHRSQWNWHTRSGSAPSLPPRHEMTRTGKPNAKRPVITHQALP